MNKTQKGSSAKIYKEISAGFALIEGLLIILILAIIGFGGYYVWNSQKNANKSLNNAEKTSQSASAQPGNNSILALKASKLKFTYDASKWTVEQNLSGTDPQCGPFDNAQMELKDKSYQLGFGLGNSCGKGGGDCLLVGACKSESKLVNIVNLSSAETAYIVAIQTTQNSDSARDYFLWLTDAKDCAGVICGINVKGISDLSLISGSFTTNGGSPPSDPGGLEQFVDLPQVKEAIAVLRTAHY